MTTHANRANTHLLKPHNWQLRWTGWRRYQHPSVEEISQKQNLKTLKNHITRTSTPRFLPWMVLYSLISTWPAKGGLVPPTVIGICQSWILYALQATGHACLRSSPRITRSKIMIEAGAIKDTDSRVSAEIMRWPKGGWEVSRG